MTWSSHAHHSHACGWVDTTTIPPLLDSLNKNRALTALVFSDSARLVNVVPEKFPMLQQVLDRNRAWQVFACSDAYISGGLQGFFNSMGMLVDTALLTAEYLLHHKPRVGAGALALVNKATYYGAPAVRRDAHSAMLDQRLAAMPDYEDGTDASVEDMIELLNGIIASREDYSAEDLRRIANGRSLDAALVVIMKRSTPNYLYLAQAFLPGSRSGFHAVESHVPIFQSASCQRSATDDARLVVHGNNARLVLEIDGAGNTASSSYKRTQH